MKNYAGQLIYTFLYFTIIHFVQVYVMYPMTGT